MMGLIVKIWLAFYLGKSAFRQALKLPTITPIQWWLWVVAGVLIEIVLLNISYRSGNAYGSPKQDELTAAAIGLIGVFVVLPSLVCWLVGLICHKRWSVK